MIFKKEYLMKTIVNQLKSNNVNKRNTKAMEILNSIDLNKFESIQQLVDFLSESKLFIYAIYKCNLCKKLDYEFILITNICVICSTCLNKIMETFLTSVKETDIPNNYFDVPISETKLQLIP